MLADDDAGRLREALSAAGYDVDTVSALLGEQAADALARGERVPALRATRRAAGWSPRPRGT